MALSGFMQGLGQQVGYDIAYQQEAKTVQQQQELRQQQIDSNKLAMADQQRQAESRMATMSDLRQSQVESKSASEQVQLLQKARMTALVNGDVSGAQALTPLIKDAEGEVDRTKSEQADVLLKKKEETSSAAADYLSTGTTESAGILIKDYLDAGGDPRSIPPPGEKFKAWAEMRQLDGKDGAKKAEFASTLYEKKREADMRNENTKLAQASLNQARQDSATLKLAMVQLKRSEVLNMGGSADAALTESDAARLAEGEKLTEIIPGTGKSVAGRRQAAESQAVKLVMKENEGITPGSAGKILAQRATNYNALRSGATAYERTAATVSANVAVASGEAREMITIASDLSKQVGAGEYRSLNAIENAVSAGTGGVKVVQLKTALNSLVNSYARAISPKGVSTVTDKEHAREVIDAALSQGQLQGVFDVLDLEMSAAGRSAKAERGTGQRGEQRPAPAALPPGTLPTGWK